MSYTNQFFCTCLSGERYCRSSGGPASCPHNTVTTTATETTMKQDKEDSVVKEAKCAICGKILNPHDIAYGYHQCAGTIRANDREPETLHQILASKDKEIAQLREEVKESARMNDFLNDLLISERDLRRKSDKRISELESLLLAEKEKHFRAGWWARDRAEKCMEDVSDESKALTTYLSRFDETIKK